MDWKEILKQIVTIHFWVNGEPYDQRSVFHVPRAGDEVRFKDDELYTVGRVVWVYDEEEHVHSRANILLEPVVDFRSIGPIST